MGMTINEALNIYKKQREEQNYDVGDYRQWGTDQIQASDVIIRYVEKYQQIEQIIQKHDNDRMSEDYWYIDKIREVIKDGNN